MLLRPIGCQQKVIKLLEYISIHSNNFRTISKENVEIGQIKILQRHKKTNTNNKKRYISYRNWNNTYTTKKEITNATVSLILEYVRKDVSVAHFHF